LRRIAGVLDLKLINNCKYIVRTNAHRLNLFKLS
jgi:hypothetical protein